MAGYSGTALWKKLGYKPGIRAHVDGAPEGYVKLLELPQGLTVGWLAKPGHAMDLVHVFTGEASVLEKKIKGYRGRIQPAGAIWASWPKKSSGVLSDITEDTVRGIALPLGLVDIKVCAVTQVWSGLKLVIRKSER